jgi:hypothetical protein
LDSALKNTSPEALKLYVDEIKAPDSPLRLINLQDGLAISTIIEPLKGNWADYIPSRYVTKVVPAFEGPPLVVKLTNDLTVYRYWGNLSSETGSPWYSLDPSMSPEMARAVMALPAENSAINVSKLVIPKDTIVILGETASQVGNPIFGPYATGNGLQIYVTDISGIKLIEQIK